MRTTALALALALLPVQVEPPGEASEPSLRELSIDDALAVLARETGRTVIPDPALQGMRLSVVTGGTLDLATVMGVLWMNGVLVLDKPEGLAVYLERNLQQREIGSPTSMEGEGPSREGVGEVYITAAVPVRHADPNGIFAVLRQIITRARGRVGDIVYVRGADVLIVKDLASNVAYYRRLVEALDVPARDEGVRRVDLGHLSAAQARAMVEEVWPAAPAATSAPGEAGAPAVEATETDTVVVVDRRGPSLAPPPVRVVELPSGRAVVLVGQDPAVRQAATLLAAADTAD
ncbi:MAG: hypothetical protein HY722_02210 [Planctomycetes bacterium]|nr:hypothetical protein [Planctomycetota bacterium]